MFCKCNPLHGLCKHKMSSVSYKLVKPTSQPANQPTIQCAEYTKSHKAYTSDKMLIKFEVTFSILYLNIQIFK